MQKPKYLFDAKLPFARTCLQHAYNKQTNTKRAQVIANRMIYVHTFMPNRSSDGQNHKLLDQRSIKVKIDSCTMYVYAGLWWKFRSAKAYFAAVRFTLCRLLLLLVAAGARARASVPVPVCCECDNQVEALVAAEQQTKAAVLHLTLNARIWNVSLFFKPIYPSLVVFPFIYLHRPRYIQIAVV